MGPVLLELRSLQVAEGSDAFFTTQTVGISRGNPSLGASVASTCLDIVAKYSPEHQGSPIVAATGITTGALCIHSFSSASSGSANDQFYRDSSGKNTGIGEGDGIQSSSSIEYYHTPRHHRNSAPLWYSVRRYLDDAAEYCAMSSYQLFVRLRRKNLATFVAPC